MSSLNLRGVQMMPGKIKLKKYLKIRKCTKNVRNPHILRTLPILPFFELLKNFGDFIWLEYCLNRFIVLWRWSNHFRKKNSKNIKKIKQGTKNVRNPDIVCTLPILHLFEILK